MTSPKKTYVISEETRKRCQVLTLTPDTEKRFTPISLELFGYLFDVPSIDFSIYFRCGREMIEFIRPSEFSKELLQKLITSTNKQHTDIDIDICVTKKEYPKFQAVLNRVRDLKIENLLSKDPNLDRRTLDLFSDLSGASQMVIKGGIDKQVVFQAEQAATSLVANLMDSEVAIGTLSRMVLADPTLYDHSAAVAMIAGVISSKILQKDKETARRIALGGLYHDVGKTCVPNHILNKPGSFSPEEFEVMKTHTTLGYDELQKAIEKGAPIDQDVALVALQHHEKFCGGGYPNNRQGRLEEQNNGIHEFSRIVSIADVYSALLMKRVYKEAFSPEKALEIMKKNAPTDYDPIVFRPFLTKVERSTEYYDVLDKQAKDKGRIIIIEDEKSGNYHKKSS